MRKAFHAIITGRVQGVFFRQNTKARAEFLNITGFTKNLKDGSVEVWAEGDEKNLEEILKFLKKGPKEALVEEIKIEWKPPKNYPEFNILY